MTNTISAAANPALVNQAVKEAMTEKPIIADPEITSPSDNMVTLPGGYITATGEVIMTAEVRELTGKDEEAISKTNHVGKALMTILQRGTVRVGDLPANEQIFDRMLSGDRDMLLVAIFRATFGNDADISAYCSSCVEAKTVTLDIDKDIPVKRLVDPVNDRLFTVKSKNHEYTVQLPTGVVQKELITNVDKTSAELNSLVLKGTLVQIDGAPVISNSQVQNIGLVDRRTILEEINKRVAGPQFDNLVVVCPDCESEVTVPINLGTLFRF